MNINISRKGWRKREPLDDVLIPEMPRLLAQCLEMMIETRSKKQILMDLAMPQGIVESLCSVPVGTLDPDDSADLKIVPIPKPDTVSKTQGGGEILPFTPVNKD